MYKLPLALLISSMPLAAKANSFTCFGTYSQTSGEDDLSTFTVKITPSNSVTVAYTESNTVIAEAKNVIISDNNLNFDFKLPVVANIGPAHFWGKCLGKKMKFSAEPYASGILRKKY